MQRTINLQIQLRENVWQIQRMQNLKVFDYSSFQIALEWIHDFITQFFMVNKYESKSGVRLLCDRYINYRNINKLYCLLIYFQIGDYFMTLNNLHRYINITKYSWWMPKNNVHVILIYILDIHICFLQSHLIFTQLLSLGKCIKITACTCVYWICFVTSIYIFVAFKMWACK